MNQQQSIVVNGKKFNSLSSAAKHFNVPVSTAYQRQKKGLSPEAVFGVEKKASKPQKHPIKVKGKTFESIAAFAKHFNVNPNKVRPRLHRGQSPEAILQALGVPLEKTQKTQRKTYRVDGKTHRSITSLSKTYGVSAKKIRERLDNGWTVPQAVGAAPAPNAKTQTERAGSDTITLTVKGKTYPNMAAIAADFSVDADELSALIAQEHTPEQAVSQLSKPKQRPRANQKVIHFQGQKYPSLAAFAKAFNLSPQVVRGRLVNGWTKAEAVGVVPRDKTEAAPKSHTSKPAPKKTTSGRGRKASKRSGSATRKKSAGGKQQSKAAKKATTKTAAKSTKVTVKGKEYDSEQAAAKAYKVPLSIFNERRQQGWPIKQALGITPRPSRSTQPDTDTAITCHGVTYNTAKELAIAYDIKPSTLYYRLKRKGLSPEDAVRSKKTGKHLVDNRKSIEFDGKRYASIKAFAEAFGQSPQTVYQRLHNGWSKSEAIGQTPRKNKRGPKASTSRGKTVTVNGVSYPSLKALAEAFDMRPHKVRQRLLRGWSLAEAVEQSPRDATADKPTSRGSQGKTLSLNGTQYPSVAAFARAIGTAVHNVHYRLKQGWSPRKIAAHARKGQRRPQKTERRGKPGTQVTLNGKTYRSIPAFAKAMKQPVHIVRYRLKKGMTPAEAVASENETKTKAPRSLKNISDMTPFVVEGKTFETATALAEHYKMNAPKVTGRLRNGWTPEEAVELDKPSAKQQRSNKSVRNLQVNGVTFNSVNALAKQYKKSPAKVKALLNQGATAAQAVGERPWKPTGKPARQVTYKGKVYPNYQSLCEALGVSYNLVMGRLHRNWPLEKALTRPSQKQAKQKTQKTRAPSQAKSEVRKRAKSRQAKGQMGLFKDLPDLPELKNGLQFEGQTFHNVADFAHHLSMEPDVVQKRLVQGWTPEQIAGNQPPPHWH